VPLYLQAVFMVTGVVWCGMCAFTDMMPISCQVSPSTRAAAHSHHKGVPLAQLQYSTSRVQARAAKHHNNRNNSNGSITGVMPACLVLLPGTVSKPELLPLLHAAQSKQCSRVYLHIPEGEARFPRFSLLSHTLIITGAVLACISSVFCGT